jgi:hypothetical protein
VHEERNAFSAPKHADVLLGRATEQRPGTGYSGTDSSSTLIFTVPSS